MGAPLIINDLRFQNYSWIGVLGHFLMTSQLYTHGEEAAAAQHEAEFAL